MLAALKILSTCLVGLICFIFYLIGTISFGEQYFRFDPWIDTERSKNYDEKKFNTLKIGDSKEKLIELIGLPLSISQDDNTPTQAWYYTGDGKCEWGDFAWFERTVIIDSTNRIVRIQKILYND